LVVDSLKSANLMKSGAVVTFKSARAAPKAGTTTPLGADKVETGALEDVLEQPATAQRPIAVPQAKCQIAGL
jgi:hypothetical protein